MESSPTFDALAESARQDKFEWADYALPYVISSVDNDVPLKVQQQADEFAERLATVNSNTIPIYLAEYYFNTGRPEKAFDMIDKYVDYVSSDQSAWQQAFNLLQTYADDTEGFRSEVAHLAEKLEQWNAENIGNIQLEQAQYEFIAEYTGIDNWEGQ